MTPGSACVLRFLSIDDVARHIITNAEICDTTEYNIGRVEATRRFSDFPCLYNYKKFGDKSHAAILFAFNGAHEDSSQFRSTMAQKTICNLIACLSFTRILNPRQWQSQDINEILKIGYKLLCSVASNHVSISNENLWNQFENIVVTSVNMSVKLGSEHNGTFSGRIRRLPTAANSVEILQVQENISELNLRSASKPSITFSDGKQSTASTIFHVDKEHSESLLTILQNLEDEREAFATLHSNLFDIAIFKHDRFYFVFDPKASDVFGFLVCHRLENFIKRTMTEENKKLLGAMSDTKVKRASLLEELQQLFVGRKVVFIPALKRPSLHIIAPFVESNLMPVMICETGSSYVAWFSSVDLLHQHIMSKIPPRFINEVFTLRQFTVTKTQLFEETPVKWNSFESVAVDQWILRASLSQNDTQFAQFNRNNQDIPNAIIALTFAQLCNATDWTSTILDVILKLADRLYKKSLARLVKISSCLPNNLRLRLEQLDLPIFLRPFVISVSDELLKKEMMVKSNDSEPLETMKASLFDFFSSTEPTGILSSKDYHVTVWKADDGAFMMFDSHDVGPKGIRMSTGFACLQRFSDHKKLVEVFHRSVKNLDGINEYQLTRVSVVKNHFRETNEDGDHRRLSTEADNLSIFSDYNLFTSIGDVRSIRALEASTVEWTQENIPMGICYAIATLCISRSLDPEFYTRDIIDKIIASGNDLISQCEGICYSDFDLCNQQLCPDEVNWNLELNNVYANIQMDIFQRGIVSIHPCPAPNLLHSIEEFFNFYSVGILVTESFIVAIWKEPGEFFIFYSSPIDEVGRMATSRRVQTGDASLQTLPGLVVFKTVLELYENIIGNIDRSSYCKPFELRICTITMTDFSEEREESVCKCNRYKKLVNEEFVLPAIEAIEKPKADEKDAENDCKANAKEELIELIRAQKGYSRDFIPFGSGKLICGQLSRNSKIFNEFTRSYHVSF